MMHTKLKKLEQIKMKEYPGSDPAKLQTAVDSLKNSEYTVMLNINKDNKPLVTIHQNGDIEFGENYTPDPDAKVFRETFMKFNNHGIDLTNLDGEGEPLDTPKKVIDHLKAQIDELGDFILKNYDDYICGSAVETAIHVMKTQSQKILTAHHQHRLLAKSYHQEYITAKAMHQPIEDEIDDEMDFDYVAGSDTAQHYPKVKKPSKINLIIQVPKKSVGENVTVEEADYNRAKQVI